jgi:hypothetical protein
MGKEKKISAVIKEITGLQAKNAIIPLTWKNTLQERNKQSTEAKNSTKTIQSHNMCKYDDKREEITRNRDYNVTILDQGREHCN